MHMYTPILLLLTTAVGLVSAFPVRDAPVAAKRDPFHRHHFDFKNIQVGAGQQWG
ncbi:hypothetical protein QCA50_016082 [Cerrena zonata]|uniref:Uncharacterized protein n=1 Tax=Cerrena zonata TaxID=2478898 RepID=A0AAW0FML1_9APHY